MIDPVEFGKQMGAIVREATAPLLKRIEELEARQPERGEKGDPGDRGADAPPVEVAEVVQVLLAADELKTLVDLHAAAAVEALPKPMDGKDGEIGPRGEKGDAGEKGADGKDGAGIADLLIDRDGGLVATMTDGRTKSLGVVVGKDGARGENGKDGADFSKCEPVWEGERTLVIRSNGGEIRKTFSVPIDRGYWMDGMACEKGDMVTHDGTLWMALRDTRAAPSVQNKDDWRIAARKGRDGKDGKNVTDKTKPVDLKKPKKGENDDES